MYVCMCIQIRASLHVSSAVCLPGSHEPELKEEPKPKAKPKAAPAAGGQHLTSDYSLQ